MNASSTDTALALLLLALVAVLAAVASASRTPARPQSLDAADDADAADAAATAASPSAQDVALASGADCVSACSLVSGQQGLEDDARFYTPGSASVNADADADPSAYASSASTSASIHTLKPKPTALETLNDGLDAPSSRNYESESDFDYSSDSDCAYDADQDTDEDDVTDEEEGAPQFNQQKRQTFTTSYDKRASVTGVRRDARSGPASPMEVTSEEIAQDKGPFYITGGFCVRLAPVELPSFASVIVKPDQTAHQDIARGAGPVVSSGASGKPTWDKDAAYDPFLAFDCHSMTCASSDLTDEISDCESMGGSADESELSVGVHDCDAYDNEDCDSDISDSEECDGEGGIHQDYYDSQGDNSADESELYDRDFDNESLYGSDSESEWLDQVRDSPDCDSVCNSVDESVWHESVYENEALEASEEIVQENEQLDLAATSCCRRKWDRDAAYDPFLSIDYRSTAYSVSDVADYNSNSDLDSVNDSTDELELSDVDYQRENDGAEEYDSQDYEPYEQDYDSDTYDSDWDNNQVLDSQSFKPVDESVLYDLDADTRDYDMAYESADESETFESTVAIAQGNGLLVVAATSRTKRTWDKDAAYDPFLSMECRSGVDASSDVIDRNSDVESVSGSADEIEMDEAVYESDSYDNLDNDDEEEVYDNEEVYDSQCYDDQSYQSSDHDIDCLDNAPVDDHFVCESELFDHAYDTEDYDCADEREWCEPTYEREVVKPMKELDFA